MLVHDLGPNWELISDAINNTLHFKVRHLIFLKLVLVFHFTSEVGIAAVLLTETKLRD